MGTKLWKEKNDSVSAMQKLKEKYFWKSRNTLDTREITTRKYLTVAMKGENCKRKEKILSMLFGSVCYNTSDTRK